MNFLARLLNLLKKIPIWIYVFLVLAIVLELVYTIAILKLGKALSYNDGKFLFHSFAVVNMQLLMFLGTIYIYYRFAAAFPVKKRDTLWIALGVFVRIFLVSLLLFAHASSIFYMSPLPSEVSPWAYISMTALAAWIHLILFFIFTDLILLVIYLILKIRGKVTIFGVNGFFMNHRLKQVFIVLALTIAFLAFGLYRTLTPPKVVRETVVTEKMKPGSELKIVLLTDIHIGPSVGKSRVEQIVNDVNQLEPDIVAIAGDLADGYVKDLGEAASPFCSLTPKLGVYFATGNHEYFHGEVDEWFVWLKACNITVLHNENRRLDTGNGNSICIAGVDDYITLKIHHPGHKMNPKQALSGCKKEDLVVLLAHQPNADDMILTDDQINGNLDVILSGHTHNGQFIFFWPLTELGNKYNHGHYHNRPTNTHILVSAGVDFFGPPIRTAGFCEIVELTVKGQQEA
ncbi:unnamed protein product, partial [Mesorhabditis belari]|uniref:Calcineurin-like phosphoesterase domain-containing protein n=1 Tax=Mesorhabditis belari TaxID=2138241 RepID=A0AAF3EIG7_9BILA